MEWWRWPGAGELEGARSALTVRELPPPVIKETQSAEEQKYRRVRFLYGVGFLVVKKKKKLDFLLNDCL